MQISIRNNSQLMIILEVIINLYTLVLMLYEINNGKVKKN